MNRVSTCIYDRFTETCHTCLLWCELASSRGVAFCLFSLFFFFFLCPSLLLLLLLLLHNFSLSQPLPRVLTHPHIFLATSRQPATTKYYCNYQLQYQLQFTHTRKSYSPMSLYIEAARIIQRPRYGGLRGAVFSDASIKSRPEQLYALIIESLKHQEIINEVLDKSGLLEIEKKVCLLPTCPCSIPSSLHPSLNSSRRSYAYPHTRSEHIYMEFHN
jgi:hypothetical protein